MTAIYIPSGNSAGVYIVVVVFPTEYTGGKVRNKPIIEQDIGNMISYWKK